jgi:XRE family transcriptional regulator, aerobic/anaerobic benzoate catabolism transcriptional regulator
MPGVKQSEPKGFSQKNRATPTERNDLRFLQALGGRIRALRSEHGMTRRALAARSGVSERFLAQLEGGKGNASILVLREVARALEVPLETLVLEGLEPGVAFGHVAGLLRNLTAQELSETQQWLRERFGANGARGRRERIALVGLRGAGKSTLGPMLARELGCPFIELDRLVEKASGVPMSAIFDLYGQEGFRRLERRCLDEVLAQHPRFVLATGGSLVTAPATFQRLLESCFTVWLKASPEDHMKRVIAQGDTRPMAENPEAMSDLRGILRQREPLYNKADLVVNTSEKPVQSVLAGIAKNLHSWKFPPQTKTPQTQ